MAPGGTGYAGICSASGDVGCFHFRELKQYIPNEELLGLTWKSGTVSIVLGLEPDRMVTDMGGGQAGI
jgi:hypothetical protein